MSSSVKSTIALSIICLIGFTGPVGAQVASISEPQDEVGSPRSKIVDVDIVTNSPTFQSQSFVPQSQSTFISPWLKNGAVQPETVPQQNGLVQQSILSSDTTTPYPTTQYSSPSPSNAVPQTTDKQTIQVDSQTVGRVVGVAGTALLLGAFLKNGGVGGMMNTFGLDNRFHSRGSSLAPY